jgi:Secretion system C-terminal sorting domain
MKNILTVLLFIITLQSQGQLVIQSGAEIKITGNEFICLENINLKNDGTINQAFNTGKYIFTGNGNSIISGSGSTNFDVLETAKTATSNIFLLQNIGVNKSVTFNGGLIDLNAYNITLGTNGQLDNESENSRIIGPNSGLVIKTVTINTPLTSPFDPGNLGVQLTTNAVLGVTTFKRGHQSQMNGAGNGNSILRYFDIAPANNTALSATARFKYFDAELNSLDENNLVLWKSIDYGNSWSNIGQDNRSATGNFVEKNSIPDFSLWTLSTANNTLPITLLSFNTITKECAAIISWRTATEEGVSHFEVQASKDGIVFNPLAMIKAKGNNSIYNYADNLAINGNNFYRLKMVDANRVMYSNIENAKINCNGRKVAAYPNPTSNTVNITGLNTGEKILLYDITGKLLIKKTIAANTEKIKIQSLLSGSYLLKIINIKNEEIEVIKLIKQ